MVEGKIIKEGGEGADPGMIGGIEVVVDPEAVVVTSASPLSVVSSAAVGGGIGRARAIVNLHVPKNYPCARPEADLARFCRARGIAGPWVGLLTSAWTEKAELSIEAAHGIAVLAVVTVGLGNPVAAGHPSTINTIVVIDGDPEPGALVNAVITATEAKILALVDAGIRSPEGAPASGTSTDAVVIAATARGHPCRFGGPASEMGWIVARVVGAAVGAGVRRWKVENP